jgi:hypothetical protein
MEVGLHRGERQRAKKRAEYSEEDVPDQKAYAALGVKSEDPRHGAADAQRQRDGEVVQLLSISERAEGAAQPTISSSLKKNLIS